MKTTFTKQLVKYQFIYSDLPISFNMSLYFQCIDNSKYIEYNVNTTLTEGTADTIN